MEDPNSHKIGPAGGTMMNLGTAKSRMGARDGSPATVLHQT
jgi:hypothetical protein